MLDLVDLNRVASWMDEIGLGAGRITDPVLLAGGTQNILIRFTRSGRGYILRRPPLALRANSNDAMRREARILRALAGSDVPHPGLIAACQDESIIGSVFYLMEPVDGFSLGEGLPALHAGDPNLRRRMGFAMVEAIAALGKIDYRKVGLDDFGKLDNYLERQASRWGAQLDSYSELSGWPGRSAIPGVDFVARWLDENLPTDFQPGIIHGDFHPANVMFRHHSGELAAVIDWELSTLGDPLLDLGWLLAIWPDEGGEYYAGGKLISWHGFAAPDELVSHYSELTGRDLASFDWFAVLACYKLGIILEGTYARACAGKASREVGDHMHAQTIRLFKTATERISKIK